MVISVSVAADCPAAVVHVVPADDGGLVGEIGVCIADVSVPVVRAVAVVHVPSVFERVVCVVLLAVFVIVVGTDDRVTVAALSAGIVFPVEMLVSVNQICFDIVSGFQSSIPAKHHL